MDLKKALLEVLAPVAEKALEKAVEEKYDAAFAQLILDIKAKIPNDQADQIVEQLLLHVQAPLKALLLVKIEAISDKV